MHTNFDIISLMMIPLVLASTPNTVTFITRMDSRRFVYSVSVICKSNYTRQTGYIITWHLSLFTYCVLKLILGNSCGRQCFKEAIIKCVNVQPIFGVLFKIAKLS